MKNITQVVTYEQSLCCYIRETHEKHNPSCNIRTKPMKNITQVVTYEQNPSRNIQETHEKHNPSCNIQTKPKL